MTCRIARHISDAVSFRRFLYGLPFMAGFRARRAAATFFPKRLSPDGFAIGTFAAAFDSHWEESERQAFRDAMATCGGLVDVGSNHGYYAAYAEHLGKPAIAIEPEQVNLSVLRRNVGKGVTIVPAAVDEQAGIIAFYGDGDMASAIPNWQAGVGRHFRQTVRAITLDSVAGDWLPGERLFIKVDVEGFEAQVLRGAQRTLQRDAVWMIETFAETPTGASLPGHAEVLSRMEAAGFQRTELSGGNYLFSR